MRRARYRKKTVRYDTANQIQYSQAGPGANPENTGEMELMQVKTRFPHKHGKDVLDEHLAFSNIIQTIGDQHTMHPVADEGSTMAAMQTQAYPGTNHALVIGTVPHEVNTDGATPGNSPFSFLQQKKQNGAGTQIPPESVREGPVWKIVEKGVEHSLSLFNGLPSHGSLMQIQGIKNEGMKNVASAIQKYQDVISSAMLGQMPGMNFSLGQLLNNLTSAQQKTLTENMPKHVETGLKNALAIMPTSTPSDEGGFVTNGRVNPDVFFDNAVERLKDVKSTKEMIDVLGNLTSNVQITGMDQYANVSFDFEGPFGNTTTEVSTDANGNFQISTGGGDSNLQGLLSAFQSLFQNLPGAGGNSGGFFDNSELKKMFERLPPAMQKQFKENVEKHIKGESAPRARLNSAFLKTFEDKTFPFQ